MALTKISRGLLSTGISDSSDATAITIDSSEQVTFASNIHLLGSVDQRIQLSTSGSGSSPNTGDNNCHVRGNDDTLILNCAGNGSIKFQENGTERMQIDSSGNVGIGTSSPQTKGHFTKNALTGFQSRTDATLTLENNANTELYFASASTGLGQVRFGDEDSNFKGALVYNHSSDSLLFYTNGNTRMAIDSSGIINSAPTYAQTTSNSANMVVRSSGDFERSTSSRRYKNTITDATKGLEELKALRPVNYKGNNDGETVFYGLIAEEVHDAGFTEFVEYNDENEPDALRYPHMVALCIKAIQEQQTQIEALQSEINTLKGGD